MLAPALLALAALLPTSLAHFHITSPSSRDNDEDTMGTFPCGGPALVSSVRTPWPLQGGPIQLDMEHGRVAVQVLLAMGSDPGVNFNTVILPTIQEEGPGDFCIGAVSIPSSLNITDGQNATIQVVTSSETSGGLYNCADITFRSSAPTNGKCENGTTSATTYSGPANANGTGAGTTASSSASTSGTSATAAARSSGAATPMSGSAGIWGTIMFGVLGIVELV